MELTVVTETILCTHCGQACEDHSIHINEQNFCCSGCKTVYEILNEHDLCTYYELDASAGIKVRSSIGDAYAYLDQADIADSLVDFKNDSTVVIHFFIPSIHCSSCLWLLEKLYTIEPGIIRSDVSFTKKEISITYNSSVVNLRRIVELMDSLGYAPHIQLNKTTQKETPETNRSVFYKLVVAGFCASNIMLMSFPEYLGLDRETEGMYAEVFGYISIALGLPVLFYSASDFYIAAWKGIKNKMINLDMPITIGMTALFSRSVYEILTHTSAGYIDSFTGLVFFLLIGKWYQSKVYQSMSFDRDYQSYFPVAVNRVEADGLKPAAISTLRAGEEIVIRSQEIIPADATLISESAYIDYSFVTGESLPVKKHKGELIYAGGRQTKESIHLRIEKEVSQSHLLQLWNNQVFDKSKGGNSVSQLADRFGRNFTIALLILSAVTFGYWYTINIAAAFNALTAVLIVACPCALALSIPFAYGNAIRILAKKGLFLRSTEVVEKLARIDTIVFDKTGTITQSDQSAVTFYGNKLTMEQLGCIYAVVQHSTHPLSMKLAAYLKPHALHNVVSDFEEISGKGLQASIAGNNYKIGSAAFTQRREAGTLAGAYVGISVNDVFYGYYIFRNKYRMHMDTLIQQLKGTYRLYVLSGDNDTEKKQLEAIFPEAENIIFNKSPEDKLAFISGLQQQGKQVLMLGDGLNDAGALKQSNVGISVSEEVYNFSPSCDGIMDALYISSLSRMLNFSRGTVKAVKATLLFSILYNIVVITLAVQGLFSPLVAAVIMPVSSVTVVLMVVLTTNVLARKM
jgi:Cu+-exporting ATPase